MLYELKKIIKDIWSSIKVIVLCLWSYIGNGWILEKEKKKSLRIKQYLTTVELT